MSSLNTASSSWLGQLQQLIPGSVKGFLSQDPGKELLRKIDYNLLLMNSQLICLETRNSAELAESPATTNTVGNGEKLANFADSVAKAARKVIPENAKEPAVRLFLAPADFVATNVSMPGLSHDNLLSALQLQVDSLLPGVGSELKATLNTSLDSSAETIALWADNERLSKFFESLDSQGIFLASIQPRILSASHSSGHAISLDNDGEHLTLAELQNGNVLRWLMIPKTDLEHSELASQWQEELAISTNLREFQNAADYGTVAETSFTKSFNFFPAGALNAKKKVEKGRRIIAVAVLAIIALGIAASPFILQSFEVSRLERNLARERTFSNDARQDQRVVVNFESDWGALSDYPNQSIPEVMYNLERVLQPDALTSLEVSQGLIKIQGTSSAPQSILQRLEQDPMFTEVVFSRATNNSRYYIDLRLSTVNFEGYNVRYFPDD